MTVNEICTLLSKYSLGRNQATSRVSSPMRLFETEPEEEVKCSVARGGKGGASASELKNNTQKNGI